MTFLKKTTPTATEDIFKAEYSDTSIHCFKVYPWLALLPLLLLATRGHVGPYLPVGTGTEFVLQASKMAPTNKHSFALVLKTACVSS